MLRYNISTSVIEFVPPSDKLAESVALIEEYKDSKDILNSILVYVYNSYSYDSIFRDFTPEERKERVCEELFDNKILPDYFEKNNIIKRFINKFVEMSLTAVQRDHERCKKDIEDLHRHISEIPFVKKEKIRKQIEFVNPDNPDNVVIKEITVNIDIDNSDEKIKAIAVREKLYNLDAKLRKIVEAEKIEQEITAKTMFEE